MLRRRGRGRHAAALGVLLGLLAALAAPAAGGERDSCPTVKAARALDIRQLLGAWFVVQYYASSEEALAYRCMRAELSAADPGPTPDSGAQLSMNFSYSFAADPLNEQLCGNISWQVPEAAAPAHWLHAERPYEGVYNTYVLDADYGSWALLMHCAEKAGSPRYLSSLVLSRRPGLPDNVVAYLRDKLPRYGVELEYMFPMEQSGCESRDPLAASPPVVAVAVMADREQQPRARRRRRRQRQQQQQQQQQQPPGGGAR